jgi:FkbM family methyltransferase
MILMKLLFLRHLLPRPARVKLLRVWTKMLDKELLSKERKFYKSFISPGDLVFDIGANVGQKTHVFLSLGAKVIAAEPNPSCAEKIREKFQSHIRNGNLIVECLAVGKESGEIQLQTFEGHSDISSGSLDFIRHAESAGLVPTRVIMVPVITADDLIQKHGAPDFVKIDVEGMDFDVLAGLSRAPKALSFEYNMRDSLWEAAEKCFNQVERLGLSSFNFTEFAKPMLLMNEWMDGESVQIEIKRRFRGTNHWGDLIAK